ncbi:Hypothetical predicted protein [Marmota monax]|uniref:Uncharacterized protein n=1 Tax=Marmota monax TaxID=9995 RepID=A0A5E4AX99_MARMO|nr:hypothetical protein GHT09_015193 [Marmota monax]VTJ61159.1 Hypothetical predicted protein [Marmota monax]
MAAGRGSRSPRASPGLGAERARRRADAPPCLGAGRVRGTAGRRAGGVRQKWWPLP